MKLSTSKYLSINQHVTLNNFVLGLSMKILAKQCMTNNVRQNMTPSVKLNMR